MEEEEVVFLVELTLSTAPLGLTTYAIPQRLTTYVSQVQLFEVR